MSGSIEIDFLAEYFDALGVNDTCLYAICACTSANMHTALRDVLEIFLRSVYSKYAKDQEQVSGAICLEVNNVRFCDLPENYKREIITFIERIREAMLMLIGTIGAPLVLTAFSEIKDTVGEDVWDNLSKDKLRQETEAQEGEVSSKYSQNDANHGHCSSLAVLQTQRFEKGNEIFSKVYGKVAEKLKNNLTTFQPDLAYLLIANVYGDLFSYRRFLAEDMVELIVLSSIVPLNTPVQEYSHKRGALRIGVPEEKVDLVIELSKKILASKH